MFFGKQTKQSKELLVFLDIDGVLNTSNSFNTKYELHRSNMDVLADLISSGRKMGLEAKVVLTSTWRLGYEADYDKCSPQVKGLIDKLSERGIFIIGKTPLYKGKTRDLEILRYIRGTQYSLATLHHYITNEESEEFEKHGHYIDYSLCKVPALHPQYCVGKIEYLKTLDKSQWHDEMKSMMYEEA